MVSGAASIFTESDRQRMLTDIACVALTIGRDLYPGESLADQDLDAIAAGRGASPDICPRERIAFLQAIWPTLENALRRIESAPDTALRVTSRMTALERARRATTRTLLQALARSPKNAGPRRVMEQVPLPCTDTPANRMVKTLLTTMLRDTTAIAEMATVVGAGTVAADALRLRERLRRTLRREPWRRLPIAPGNALPPLPQSVRTSGPYRLLYDCYRRYREGFAFDWRQPLFTLPAREMWLLYEYWCLFQVARTLRQMGFCTVEAEGFSLTRSGLTFSLVRGAASSLTFIRPDGVRLTVTYNRRFPASAEAPDRIWHTRSHAMTPDIVVQNGNRLLTLDAKFKTYAETQTGDEENLPLTADINQCHAYRDGILHKGSPAVTAAYLLYPGRASGGNRPILSYGGACWSEVGGVLLRPSVESALDQLLVQWISSGATD